MPTYCARCNNRRFKNAAAYEQHVENSRSHYTCNVCDYDGVTWSALLDHHRQTKHRTACQGCDNGDGKHWQPNCAGYWQHVVDENVCTECERHFANSTCLTQHKRTHLEATQECYGCYRKFALYCDMIAHLETGSCPCEIDIYDLNQSAAKFRQWKWYVNKDWRLELLNCEAIYDDEDGYYCDGTPLPFKCPSCDVDFPKLSSLFQHIQSPACSQKMNKYPFSKLRRYLQIRHEL